jgi:hypothetical protein
LYDPSETISVTAVIPGEEQNNKRAATIIEKMCFIAPPQGILAVTELSTVCKITER